MKMMNRFLTCSTMCWAFVLVCLCFSGAMAQMTKYQTITTTVSNTNPGPGDQVDLTLAYSTAPAETTTGISFSVCYDTTKVIRKGPSLRNAYSDRLTLFQVVPDYLDGQNGLLPDVNGQPANPSGRVVGPSVAITDDDSDPSTQRCLSTGYLNEGNTISFPTSISLIKFHFVMDSNFGVTNNGLTQINIVITGVAGGWTRRVSPASIILSNPNTNHPPVFTSPDTFRVAENTTAVGTVMAPDPNAQDNVTYAFVGSSPDTADFDIGSTTGALSFSSAPNYESPTDRAITTPSNAATNNEYILIVQAAGGAGARAMTANDTLVVIVTNVVAPVAPTGLTATAGDAHISLTWTDPQNSTITSYDYSSDGGTTWTAIPSSGASTTSYTVTSLMNGTAYAIQLRAVNAEGNGAAATASSATPLSSDATLSALTISQGTLAPTFASTITAYRATVPNATTSLMVTPTVNEANATVQVNGTTVASGSASSAITLSIGDNAIAVAVTAQNTTTILTYTATVLRQIAVTGGTNTEETEEGQIKTEVSGTTVELILPKSSGTTAVTFSKPTVQTVARPNTARFATSETFIDITGATLPTDSTATVCLPAAFSDLPIDQQLVYHLPQGATEWVALPRVESSEDGFVCGRVTTFSPFTVGTVERPDTAPSGLEAAGSDRTVALTWSNPQDPTLTGYQLRYKTVDGDYNEWTLIENSDAGTIRSTLTDLENGLEYVLQLRAINSGGNGPVSEVTALTQSIPPPAFTDALDPQYYQQGTPVTLKFPEVIGGEGQLTYELTLPVSGLTYTPPSDEDEHGGVLSGTPTTAQDRATYTLTVTDEGGTVLTLSFILLVKADLIPTFGDSQVAAQNYVQNREIEALTLPQATGGDGTLSHTLTPDLPDGLTFDVETHVLSGTPLEAIDETTYKLTASDADGDAIILSFSLVIAADLMPTFGDSTMLTAQRYTMGIGVNLELPVATGGDGTLSYILFPSPPDGLTFDNETRVLSGTPIKTMVETEYTLTALDADGDAASLTFTLDVQLPSPDFNDDGQVNFADFVIFAGKFGTQRGQDRYDARCDLNGDGQIGFDDFLIFVQRFGSDV